MENEKLSLKKASSRKAEKKGKEISFPKPLTIFPFS